MSLRFSKNVLQDWDAYTGNLFPLTLANDTANLNGFRHYMIQDVLYLEDYYRVRTQSVCKSGSFEEIMRVAAKLSNSLEYVIAARADCTDKLGVPQDVVKAEEKSDELKNSIALHERVLQEGDWLDMHIVFLPCILVSSNAVRVKRMYDAFQGYYTIATKLSKDPETIRNTIYYPLWIQAMSSGSSSREYTRFINSNINATELENEEGLLVRNLQGGMQNREWPSSTLRALTSQPTKSWITGSTRFKTTATITSLFQVQTRSLPKRRNQATQALWKLTNILNGYTIESISGGKGFLNGHVSGDLIKPFYYVKVSKDSQNWPINIVDGMVQIFLQERTEFVLDAGRDENDREAFVTNNSQISSQLWRLIPANVPRKDSDRIH
ncbi:hypothetical protein HD554DRAFT_450453 [Boletus coccyginus]|nr:hypothetical protein HD554DRAFT_450453 [Boletus coccyginus]